MGVASKIHFDVSRRFHQNQKAFTCSFSSITTSLNINLHLLKLGRYENARMNFFSGIA
jgi:hypothetical protein